MYYVLHGYSWKWISCVANWLDHSVLSFRCQCVPEFVGSNCEVPYVPCSPSPCQNGGSCIVVAPRGYECKCVAGECPDSDNHHTLCWGFIILQSVAKLLLQIKLVGVGTWLRLLQLWKALSKAAKTKGRRSCNGVFYDHLRRKVYWVLGFISIVWWTFWGCWLPVPSQLFMVLRKGLFMKSVVLLRIFFFSSFLFFFWKSWREKWKKGGQEWRDGRA